MLLGVRLNIEVGGFPAVRALATQLIYTNTTLRPHKHLFATRKRVSIINWLRKPNEKNRQSHGVPHKSEIKERTRLYSKGVNLLLCHDVVREVGRSELVPFHKRLYSPFYCADSTVRTWVHQTVTLIKAVEAEITKRFHARTRSRSRSTRKSRGLLGF